MKCPVCALALTTHEAGPLHVEVCESGCGGIWFEAHELEQVDEDTEPVCRNVLRFKPNPDVPIDFNKARMCPKCHSSHLVRQFYDSTHMTEIESCIACGGVWLDLAELDWIRQDNKLKSERERKIKQYLEDNLPDSGLELLPDSVRAVFKLIF